MFLQIDHLNVFRAANGNPIIQDLSFALNEYDKIAVIGEEGNGKSTLLKLIFCGELPYVEYDGKIKVFDNVLGYLPQELTKEEKSLSLEQFADEFLNSPISRNELYNAFKKVNFQPVLWQNNKTVGELSGGERIKFQLALLSVLNADIFLLDEPTNDVDTDGLQYLEEFILNTNKPVLYVSHDETLLENTANCILHLEQLRGKNVARSALYRTDYQSYVAARQQKFSKQRQEAVFFQSQYEKQTEKWRQIYQKVEYRQATITRADAHGGRLLKKKMASVKATERRLEKSKDDAPLLPEYEEPIDLKFSPTVLPADKIIVDLKIPILQNAGKILATNLILSVKGRDRIGIIGANGAGKSTLLKQIAREISARRDISVGYLPQNYEELLDYQQSPVNFLKDNLTQEKAVKAYTILGNAKFTKQEMDGKIAALSGGQKAKLCFVYLILQEYDVLLLDEPTRNFSPLSAPVIRKSLQSFGGCIIAVTHDRKLLKEVCRTIYSLNSNGLTVTE